MINDGRDIIGLRSTPVASVVIATKNRCDELLGAVRSALSQSIAVEIVVMDDASTDGTADMVRRRFPTVRLVRSENSQGYIAQRNRGACIASGDIIFSIDDDAVFTSNRTVAQTLAEFDHPRIGAVAIPYIEPRKSNYVHQQGPSKDCVFLTSSFIGTAHAVRKDVFLKLRGYREHLVHQGEESDYCIRMLQAGYVVRLGSGDPIHHMESPDRDWRRMDYYGRRNDILFAWQNTPASRLPLHLLGTTYLGLRHALRTRRLSAHVRGIASGWKAALSKRSERTPVKLEIYSLFRKLKKLGPMRLTDIEYRLPSLME